MTLHICRPCENSWEREPELAGTTEEDHGAAHRKPLGWQEFFHQLVSAWVRIWGFSMPGISVNLVCFFNLSQYAAASNNLPIYCELVLMIRLTRLHTSMVLSKVDIGGALYMHSLVPKNDLAKWTVPSAAIKVSLKWLHAMASDTDLTHLDSLFPCNQAILPKKTSI